MTMPDPARSASKLRDAFALFLALLGGGGFLTALALLLREGQVLVVVAFVGVVVCVAGVALGTYDPDRAADAPTRGADGP